MSEASVYPTPGGRWLHLPVIAAVGEDTKCSCLVCGLPRSPRWGDIPEGLPVEYLAQTRTGGSTIWQGLHQLCWERSVAGLPDFIGALDAANKLIGEAADEAKALTDERDLLGEQCVAYEEKFKLQREVVDAALQLMLCGDGHTSEEYDKRYTALSDAARAMWQAAKERGDGTV